MLKKILLGLAVIIGLVLAYSATKPDTFALERSIIVKAPPEAVFHLVNDFRKWRAWSPWEKLDLNMQRTHSGAQYGQGAVYEWQGNSDVGKGRMEIIESAPASRIAIDLDFIEPMEVSNITEFTFTPQNDGTEVRWSMRGPSPYMSKVMQVFVSMDALVGKDFESGLAALKAEVEKARAAAPAVPASESPASTPAS